jgi:hypothetical protein
MIKRIAIWYLMKCMKDLDHVEMVINNEYYTYRARDKNKEELLEHFKSK